jgi:hypothetical protein
MDMSHRGLPSGGVDYQNRRITQRRKAVRSQKVDLI